MSNPRHGRVWELVEFEHNGDHTVAIYRHREYLREVTVRRELDAGAKWRAALAMAPRKPAVVPAELLGRIQLPNIEAQLAGWRREVCRIPQIAAWHRRQSRRTGRQAEAR